MDPVQKSEGKRYIFNQECPLKRLRKPRSFFRLGLQSKDEGILRQELHEEANRHRQREFQFSGCLSARQKGLRQEFQKKPSSPVPL